MHGGGGNFEWVELKDLGQDDFDKIEYSKSKTTRIIKDKINEIGLTKLKETYFENPIFISDRPIPIKKVRQKAWFQDLYEITKGRYVYSRDAFMVYFFIARNNEEDNYKREIKFLKFIDAIGIIDSEKPNKIDYTKLIDKQISNDEFQEGIKYDLLFTLAKNDLVYLPETILTKEQIDEINWDNKQTILPYLYVVKDMNPSLEKILFQHINKADAIKITEADAKSLFKNSDMKEQIEEIKYGTVDMLQRCIKVFTDKLGTKVIPYWEFTNGSWNKETAKKLGLIQ